MAGQARLFDGEVLLEGRCELDFERVLAGLDGDRFHGWAAAGASPEVTATWLL